MRPADPAPETDGAQHGSDAEWYSAHYGVSVAEANRRLDLGDLAGELDARLSSSERATFAGLWIAHEPEFAVEVRMLPGHVDAVSQYVRDDSLSEVVNVESRQPSLVELVEVQLSLHEILPPSVDFSSGVDVRTGTVLTRIDERDEDAVAAVDLPDLVDVEIGTSPEDPALAIYGGLALSPCTSGYSVDQVGGFQQGVSTAGHCANSVTYQGNDLPFQDGQQNGNTDAQWHTTPDYSDPNQFDSGIDVRDVLRVWSRAEQAVGDPVCKNGKTTGYTCGGLSSKTWDPSDNCVDNSTATWMYAAGPNTDLGDSGGPVFKNNGARGVVVCKADGGQDLIYMASNYMSNVGARIAEA